MGRVISDRWCELILERERVPSDGPKRELEGCSLQQYHSRTEILHSFTYAVKRSILFSCLDHYAVLFQENLFQHAVWSMYLE